MSIKDNDDDRMKVFIGYPMNPSTTSYKPEDTSFTSLFVALW